MNSDMIRENLLHIKKNLPNNVTLVAVSKTKPIADLQEAYDAGQRIFGENKIQEMVDKHDVLPKDIQWHMIGHLQRNKVKYIAPFVSLIHSVDSVRLLREIDKQAQKNDRIIDCLLQMRIAREETKFGLTFKPEYMPVRFSFTFYQPQKNNFISQEFMPDKIKGTKFYEPGNNSRENVQRDFLKNNWKDKYGY